MRYSSIHSIVHMMQYSMANSMCYVKTHHEFTDYVKYIRDAFAELSCITGMH